MKIICTTSDNYHHCLPIFFEQYNKYWGDPFELVGYKKPEIELPENCTWVSLGEQRGPEYFGEDMRAYFEQQPDSFVWLMEDTFIKGFDREKFDRIKTFARLKDIGRINLTIEGTKQKHKVSGQLIVNDQDANYRLSTQPSIWNKSFLLKYLKPGLDPWQFEKQSAFDSYVIIGPQENILEHNEGVRKHNIHELNLEGI